jgi:uncharacterized protein (TIGR03437 family)
VSVVAPGSGTPPGTVIFRDGSAILGTATLVGGTATLTTSSLAVGLHAITAFYGGASDFTGSTSAELDFFESQAPTLTGIVLIKANSSATVKATVKSFSTGVPTGSVQFWSDAGLLVTLPLLPELASGAAASFPIGQFAGTLTAAYLGDSNFLPSNSTVLQIDTTPHSPTLLAMKADVNPATVGRPVAVTVDLTWGLGPVPTGNVQLLDGVVPIATSTAARQVVFNLPFDFGTHNLTANYAGDLTYLPSTAHYTLVVNRSTPTLLLYSGDGLAPFGQVVTVTANLPRAGGSTLTPPQGLVTLMEGTVVLGVAPIVNGLAAVKLPPLEPGLHQITGSYSGDSNWAPVTSGILYLTITKVVTTLDISTVSGGAASDGMSVTASLLLKAPGGGTPTGAVSFVEAASQRVLARAQVNGTTATASIPPDTGGGAIIAVYEGDARFESSRSASPGSFAVVNAASYAPTAIAPGQIVVAFSQDLAPDLITAPGLPLPGTLAGIGISITDSAGNNQAAPIYYVSPTQVAFVVPTDVVLGPATLKIVGGGNNLAAAVIQIRAAAPGLFSANSEGEFLVLYGTGLRNRSNDLIVTVNSQPVPVSYAGPQGTYPGLDQLNVRLPAGLNAGTLEVTVQVDGLSSNTITLTLN